MKKLKTPFFDNKNCFKVIFMNDKNKLRFFCEIH